MKTRFKKIMESARNVMAVWASLLVLVFCADQSAEMIRAFIANATEAFKQATEARTILLMLALALVLVAIGAIIRKLRNRKVKE